MLKFLRKYNKLILVIGGSLLMVVFLLPQAIQQFGPNPLNARVFEAAGVVYRGKDLNRGQREFAVLSTLERAGGVALTDPDGMRNAMSGGTIFRPENEEHWLMLAEQAERLGLVGGPDDARRLLREAARIAGDIAMVNAPTDEEEIEQRAQLTREALDRLLDARAAAIAEGNTPEFVDGALARAFGVVRMRRTYFALPSVSAREVAYAAQRIGDRAVADVAVILPESVQASVGAITDEDIRSHFEAYRDDRPADNPYGFGYRQPAQVRAEILLIDPARIRSAVELDEVEVRKHWRQNADRFAEDFDRARTLVESEMRTEATREALAEAQSAVATELFKAHRTLGDDGAIYKRLPDNWASQRPSFQSLADAANEAIEKTVALDEPAATVELSGENWMTGADLRELPAGRTTINVGPIRASLANFIMNVREINPDAELPLQEGLTDGPYGRAGQAQRFVRVLEAKPEGPAESVEAVENEVLADLRQLRIFESLAAELPELGELVAERGGIGALFDEYPDLFLGTELAITRDAVTSDNQTLNMSAFDAEPLRSAVIDRVRGWDPLADASELPLAERVVTAELPRRRGVAVAVIQSRRPVTSETIRAQAQSIQQELFRQFVPDGTAAPFSFAAMQDRLGYRAFAADEPDPDLEEAEETEDAEPAGDEEA